MADNEAYRKATKESLGAIVSAKSSSAVGGNKQNIAGRNF